MAAVGVAGGGFVTLELAFSVPLFLRVVTISVFGWAAVASAARVLTRRVAFRADAAGLTLSGSPFRCRSTTRVFPWPDVDSVMCDDVDVLFVALGRIKSPLLRPRHHRACWPEPRGWSAPGSSTETRLAAAISALAPNVELTILR